MKLLSLFIILLVVCSFGYQTSNDTLVARKKLKMDQPAADNTPEYLLGKNSGDSTIIACQPESLTVDSARAARQADEAIHADSADTVDFAYHSPATPHEVGIDTFAYANTDTTFDGGNLFRRGDTTVVGVQSSEELVASGITIPAAGPHYLTEDSNGDIYSAVRGNQIYKQTGGIGSFAAIGPPNRYYSGVAIDKYDSLWTCTDSGSGRVGAVFRSGDYGVTWDSLSWPDHNYAGIGFDTLGNLYLASYGFSIGGKLWIKHFDTDTLDTLSEPALNYRGFACNKKNNDMYVAVSFGDIRKQVGGVGSFAPQTHSIGGAGVNWINCAVDTFGNVYASSSNYYQFKQANGVGTFTPIPNSNYSFYGVYGVVGKVNGDVAFERNGPVYILSAEDSKIAFHIESGKFLSDGANILNHTIIDDTPDLIAGKNYSDNMIVWVRPESLSVDVDSARASSVADSSNIAAQAHNSDSLGGNPSAYYDTVGNGLFLKLDQTTPQTVENGVPVFENGINLPTTIDNTTGIIYKNGDPILHDYHNPTGGSSVPAGWNIFLGEGAGNFTFGSDATSTTDASYNIGIGRALYSLTRGYRNTAIGYVAGGNTTTGTQNVYLGALAGYLNNTGSNNFGMGYQALYRSYTGENNIAIGRLALTYLNATSKAITAFSDYSGTVAGAVLVTSASHGLSVGTTAGVRIVGTINYDGNSYTVTYVDASHFYFTHAWEGDDGVALWDIYEEGKNNIGIGSLAGYKLTKGSNSVFIGYNSGVSTSQLVTANNSTAIGANSYTTSDNQMVFGNENITQTWLRGDNNVLTFGTAADAGITYNGTNMVFDSRLVGTGNFSFQGGTVNIENIPTSSSDTVLIDSAGTIKKRLASSMEWNISQIVSLGDSLAAKLPLHGKADSSIISDSTKKVPDSLFLRRLMVKGVDRIGTGNGEVTGNITLVQNSVRSEGTGPTISFVPSTQTGAVSSNYSQCEIIGAADDSGNNKAAGRFIFRVKDYIEGVWGWRNALVIKSVGDIDIENNLNVGDGGTDDLIVIDETGTHNIVDEIAAKQDRGAQDTFVIAAESLFDGSTYRAVKNTAHFVRQGKMCTFTLNNISGTVSGGAVALRMSVSAPVVEDQCFPCSYTLDGTRYIGWIIRDNNVLDYTLDIVTEGFNYIPAGAFVFTATSITFIAND